MREVGFVEKTDGKIAVVKVAKKSACGENCASCKGGCTPGERRITVKNKIAAKPGETVVLEMPGEKVIFAAFLAYILPIIVFFAGFFAGERIFKHELAAVVCGVIVAAVGIFALNRHNKKEPERYMAEITEVLKRRGNA